MLYIVSTMSSSVEYCNYDTSRKDINVLLDSVVIKGGTGVADKKTLICAEGGIITPITEQQFEWLKNNPLFKHHQNNGFLKVVKSKSEAERQADKPELLKDKSAQLKDKDFEEQGIEKPKVSTEEVMTTDTAGQI